MSAAELRHLLINLGEAPMRPEEADAFLRLAEIDKHGMIKYSTFVHKLISE